MKKKIILPILVFLFTVLFLLVHSCKFGYDYKASSTLKGYDNVISEGVGEGYQKRIVDIALLGAHDAFSNEITNKSKGDPNDGGICNNELVNALGSGLVARLSRAQADDAKTMLYAGVRYFDVRITKVDNVYYTYHGYLSGKLEDYVRDVVEFLNSHPKEYVIFDIQHFYASTNGSEDNDYLELFEFLDDLGLMEHALYTVDNDTKGDIGNLTYGDVTNSGTKGGVVVLAKTRASDKVYFRDGDGSDEAKEYYSTRSVWINSNSTEVMLEGIEREKNIVKAHNTYNNILRINQAQKTGFVSDISIVSSVLNWSLLNLANNFNSELVSDKERFISWLDAMPIFMVDYATSEKGNFNTLVNEYIKEYNISKR